MIGSIDLKRRNDIHWARKIWHMAGVSLIAVIYAYTPILWSKVLLLLVLLFFIPLDFLRQRNQSLNQFMLNIFKPILRENEIHKLAGTTYLLSGVAVVVFFFPREVATLTLLILAFADPFASIFGIKFGKDKIFGQKSLQGSMAAFFVCAFLTFGYMFYHAILIDRILIISLLAGLVGALAELIPLGKLDDNFTLPVVSAFALWLLFTIFGF